MYYHKLNSPIAIGNLFTVTYLAVFDNGDALPCDEFGRYISRNNFRAYIYMAANGLA